MPGEKTPIAWPLVTAPGPDSSEGRGRMINVYPEPLANDAGTLWRRAPGCTAFGAQNLNNWTWWGLSFAWFNPPQVSSTNIATGAFRGAIFVNNLIYTVIGTGVFTVDANGNFTKIGSIAGTDKVFLARNNNAPVPDIVCVAQAGAFVITSTSVSGYPDLNVGSPSCVVGHEGFFIFGYGNGNLLTTNINTTAINILNLARTETNPDGVVQMISWEGQLYVFGTATIEIWGFPVNATGFPFNRIGYNLTPGMQNDHCVAGWEPEFGLPPIYIGSDNTVRWLINDTPVEISTPDLRRTITASPNENMECCVYVADGIPFCEVSGLVGGTNEFTWVFDCRSETEKPTWYERMSYLQTRSRFTQSVFGFNQWLCGDFNGTGDLLQVTFGVAEEVGDPLIATLESLPVEDYPLNVGCPRADFEFTPGVGIAAGHQPDETDPQINVWYSNDGAETWEGPRLVRLGQQSRSKNRVTVWRTGLTGPQGRRWRISLPAAVHYGFVGGFMKAPTEMY